MKKSELESILNVLDAESDRILEGYGSGVLYGGLQEQFDVEDEVIEVIWLYFFKLIHTKDRNKKRNNLKESS